MKRIILVNLCLCLSCLAGDKPSFPGFSELPDSASKLIDTLKASGTGLTVGTTRLDYVKESDLPHLVELLDSTESCGFVALSASSIYYPGKRSTVGHEAAYLIEGFWKRYYPTQLTSQQYKPDIEGIKLWYGMWRHLKKLAEQGGADSTPTNSFGIYLTTEPVDARITAYGKGDWKHIRLAESPIISDADILTYDFTNHLMTLKPEALKRLPQPNASGTPFVVVANGERVYLGVFMVLDSSVSRAIPSIVLGERMMDTNLPPNALRISRVYAAPYSKTDPDPRSDDRIKRTLTALHKLK